MADFENIFKPIQIGSMQLENRIIMPAMHIGMSSEGYITDNFMDFYEERAASRPGPGLIVTGGFYIDKRGMGAPNFASIDNDKYVPRLKEFNERIHRCNTRTAAQLFHAGRYAFSFVIGEQPVSASDIPSRYTREKPRPLSIQEIEEIIRMYGDAAGRVREAGFDAVELICSAGYLVSQFLSPLTNKRVDRYGGDIFGRMTFLKEVIAAIRQSTGDDFPLICRVSGSDFVEGSHTLEEVKTVAVEIERSGADLISVTGGWHETKVPQITMNVPRGAFVYLAEGIRAETEGIPVACCNRINDPVLAERILAENRADLVAMGRGFIADPEMLAKAKQGKLREIRKCIACNQGCFDYVFMVKPITCTVNPRVGRESETPLVKADKPKKVLIAGGGPAGLEAAWTASKRGHEVTLCEKTHRLGGQCVLAAVPPGREEFAELVKYFEDQMEIENVRVLLDTTIDAGLMDELDPDVVILATGATQIKPDIKGIDASSVVYAWDVLEGVVETGETVVIAGGGAVGIETGMYLAEKGKNVTVLEMQARIGADIGLSSRWTILQDAANLGVEMLRNRKVVEITGGAVITLKGGEEKQREECPADTVVIAVGAKPDDESAALPQKMDYDDKEVMSIGDCVEARKAIEAIREGFDAGYRI
ncbi:MAG: FAD-dependent oxidoreductase [Actinobacteria bacterium]|nr:FAD-dependent oxidoreductase [Actinomycetota bacterium]